MNQRERFKATMRFQPVDRVPFWDYGYWEEIPRIWKAQGLPELVTGLEDYFGVETWASVPANIDLCPEFKVIVIDEDERTRLIRDEMGRTYRESKVGSSVPQFHEFPVKNRKDWEKIRERFNPDSPERFPCDWDDTVKCLNRQEKPVFIGIGGYFGFLRTLFGLEGLSIMFYDDPDLLLEIQEHMTQLRINVLQRALKDVSVDAAACWEDMAYNKGSFISAAMYRRFILPFYKRLIGLVRDFGIDIIIVDSDGRIDELIPLFIESGITAALPFEIRAGNDLFEIRRRFPTFGIVGGVDKFALIKGKKAIDEELARIAALLPEGGFIPTVDHRVPADVPLENYKYYLEKKWSLIHQANALRS